MSRLFRYAESVTFKIPTLDESDRLQPERTYTSVNVDNCLVQPGLTDDLRDFDYLRDKNVVTVFLPIDFELNLQNAILVWSGMEFAVQGNPLPYPKVGELPWNKYAVCASGGRNG